MADFSKKKNNVLIYIFFFNGRSLGINHNPCYWVPGTPLPVHFRVLFHLPTWQGLDRTINNAPISTASCHLVNCFFTLLISFPNNVNFHRHFIPRQWYTRIYFAMALQYDGGRGTCTGFVNCFRSAKGSLPCQLSKFKKKNLYSFKFFC